MRARQSLSSVSLVVHQASRDSKSLLSAPNILCSAPTSHRQMLNRNSSHFLKNFSTQTKNSSLKWRTQIEQNQLISQISTLLLQRQNWIPHLQNLHLSIKLTPTIFTQVLHKTKHNPEISFNFFNWAKTNVGFKPDLKTQCKMIHILVNSGLSQSAKPLFGCVIQTQPVSLVFESMVLMCQDKETQSRACSFVLECYSNKGLVSDGLEVFQRVKVHGVFPISVNGCNVLLDELQRRNEIRLARCFCSAIVRYEVSMNSFTWSLIARILYKEGKVENVVKMLRSGVQNAVIYNLVIDSYCKNGEFMHAVELLNEMYEKSLTPGFCVYSSILDGACKVRNFEVVERIIGDMVDKELFPVVPFKDYNSIIQKLCEFGRSYAAEMFFERALSSRSEIQDTSYGFLLKVFCKERRVREARQVYQIVMDKGITLHHKCYHAFANVICKEEPSEEVDKLLKDVITKGVIPCNIELSSFIEAQCKQCRWNEAEDLLNVVLEKGLLPDSLCCSSLVEHYCANKQIGSAVALHEKIETVGGNLDIATYNVLLVGLFRERKSEVATRMFDYMRSRHVVSSGSFSIMITGLCCEREMRKAMKLHDEMLKMGLKPDGTIYKRLISKFV